MASQDYALLMDLNPYEAPEGTERTIAQGQRVGYLPLWLHRVSNGVFAAALVAAIGVWLGVPAGGWLHIVSLSLLWSSVPVGVVFALIAHRFSIVEGIAGDLGYEEDDADDLEQPP